MNSRAEILRQVRSIPALPTAAASALQALRQRCYDVERLGRLVECDPALTANVLRLANSPYFGFSRQVASIRQAIVRLGCNQVMRLLIACSVAPQVQRSVRGYDLPAGALWSRSLGVGVGAVELARALALEAPAALFVAGLLADVGKIVLGSFVEADGEAICMLAFEHGLPFDEAERAVLGIDHAEVGAALLDYWHLPEELVEVARWHHLPQLARDAEQTAHLVHTADALCMMVGLGAGVDGLNYRVNSRLFDDLSRDEPATDQVLEAIEHHTSEVRRLFATNVAAAG